MTSIMDVVRVKRRHKYDLEEAKDSNQTEHDNEVTVHIEQGKRTGTNPPNIQKSEEEGQKELDELRRKRKSKK